jgi:hypothetical protein
MLIGLYSPAPQSGKSTVASLIGDEHQTILLPMAGPLKRFASSLLEQVGADPIFHLYNDKTAPITQLPGHPTGRHLLQSLGTEWGRGLISPDLWVDLWVRSYERTPRGGQIVLVDDVRFRDEAQAIHAAGGVMWKITRSGVDTSACDHSSEGALEDWEFDVVLINDSSVEGLALDVDLHLYENLHHASGDRARSAH